MNDIVDIVARAIGEAHKNFDAPCWSRITAPQLRSMAESAIKAISSNCSHCETMAVIYGE